MNVQTRSAPSAEAPVKQAIADCDIHPTPKSMEKEVYPFLEKKWQEVLETYGMIQRIGYVEGWQFPKGQPLAARLDAMPPAGGRPGSDLAFAREQHLDPYNVQLGVLIPLRAGQDQQNIDLSVAM